MATVHANGIETSYERLGPDDPGRLPLVLTHGFAGPSGQWRPELLPFADKRPLVLYDVRGHDRTTVPSNPAEYSMPLFAADLAAVLNAIGIERAHIGGVSMGGMVTAQFAVDYPALCASVLVCDSTCGNAAKAAVRAGEDDAAAAWEKRLAFGVSMLENSVRERGLEETQRRQHEWSKANDPHLADSPYSPEEDFERLKLTTPEGYIGAARAIADRPDLTERIPKIDAPALLMIGEWDDFLPCALRDHELISGSRLVVRKHCGHGSRWRLETFISEIEAFLDDVERGRPVAGHRVV